MTANRITRWQGNSWATLGTTATITGNGVNNVVNDIGIYDGDVYVGGLFTESYHSDVITVSTNYVS